MRLYRIESWCKNCVESVVWWLWDTYDTYYLHVVAWFLVLNIGLAVARANIDRTIVTYTASKRRFVYRQLPGGPDGYIQADQAVLEDQRLRYFAGLPTAFDVDKATNSR